MLSDAQVRKAKGAERPYKLTDSAGLHLYVTEAGTRLWRLRYRFEGREKLLSLGRYPDLGLAEARAARDEAKRILRSGQDPAVARRQQAAALPSPDTFERLARSWHALQAPTWTDRHAADVLRSLERDVFPTIGARPIAEITAPECLALLREIEAREARETARRTRQRMSAVFVFGIASGVCAGDPAAVVQGAMAPVVKGRQPAVTELAAARKILADVEASPARVITKLALRLLALTAVRPGTLVGTPWSEFDDLDAAAPTWIVPAARMKLRLAIKGDQARDHLVPLSRQAVEVIAAARRLAGRGPLVFPSSRNARKPMSENAMGYLLNRAGYHHRHVPHGWRSTFSTVLNERFRADRAVIDLMLAHVPKEKVEAAYNRAAHMDRRRELAQIWADLIMEGRPPAAMLLPAALR